MYAEIHHVCAVCGRGFLSFIDRDVHSFRAHGTAPGSTIRVPSDDAAKAGERQ